jgi:hypothetical protein
MMAITSTLLPQAQAQRERGFFTTDFTDNGEDKAIRRSHCEMVRQRTWELADPLLAAAVHVYDFGVDGGE